MTKLAGKLPSGDANGLETISQALISAPQAYHALVVLIDARKVETDTDTGVQEATARIRHIEVVTGAQRDQVEKMLHERLKERTGRDELPFDDDGADA